MTECPFIEETEYLRELDKRAWRSERLGDVMGAGGSVFNNIVPARVSDTQARGF